MFPGLIDILNFTYLNFPRLLLLLLFLLLLITNLAIPLQHQSWVIEHYPMQVLAVVRRRPEVQKISFVAHSLGGLVARYAIGRLYEHSSIVKTAALTGNPISEEHKNSMVQGHEQPHEPKIAGLEPMNFITFATPHLGSKGHKQAGSACS